MERPLNSTAKMGGIVDLSKARCVPTATEFGPKRRDYIGISDQDLNGGGPNGETLELDS